MKHHIRAVRLLALLLIFCLAFGGCVGYADKPCYAQLTVPIFFEIEIPEDIDDVNEAVNEITRAEIGAEIILVPLLVSSSYDPDVLRQTELDLMEKEGTSFDVFSSALGKSEDDLLEIGYYLENYGQDILSALYAEPVFSDFSLDEPVYTVPSVSSYTQSFGITMRRDILEACGIDPDSIQSIYDLTDVFARVREEYPDIGIVSAYTTNSAPVYRLIDSASEFAFSIALSEEDAGILYNYYAGEEFEDLICLMREWYLDGYMFTGMSYQSVYASELVREGTLFAYFSSGMPSNEMNATNTCGYEMVTVSLSDPVITNNSVGSIYWAVSKDCANPGKAVQFINLLYTNADLVNLLAYGMEGVHYTLNDDGTITGSESNDYYCMTWLLPNQLISYAYSGYAGLWEETRAYNQSAEYSLLYGFELDTQDIKTEVETVEEVTDRYLVLLTTGQIDPDIYLGKMLEEMEEAGMNKILSEAQQQYDLFLESGETGT